MTDPVTIAVAIAATFTSGGSCIAAWYYIKRISIEKQRSTDMKTFYEAQLAIEREKLDVEKAKLKARNGL